MPGINNNSAAIKGSKSDKAWKKASCGRFLQLCQLMMQYTPVQTLLAFVRFAVFLTAFLPFFTANVHVFEGRRAAGEETRTRETPRTKPMERTALAWHVVGVSADEIRCLGEFLFSTPPTLRGVLDAGSCCHANSVSRWPSLLPSVPGAPARAECQIG
jgi:hypothetical protein